jgi:uncharacterized membrane protein HdeD (DUF308 family)
MNSNRSPVTPQQVRLSTHAAAGVGTLILAFPLIVILGLAGEPIGPFLVAAVLGLFYVVLFVIYRGLAQAASIRVVNAPDGDWILVISGVAGALAGIVWLVWAWGMRQPLASLETYAPLLVGTAFLWATLAAGAVVQRYLMRRETRRVPI